MRQQSGDASLLRRLNSAAILRILRASEDVTLTELAKAAKVSRPTAEAIVEELLAEGWAEEGDDEQGDRQRGRPRAGSASAPRPGTSSGWASAGRPSGR